MKTSDTVLKELELGYMPFELSYDLEVPVKIDWTALNYNDWAQYSYWLAKQPSGLIEQWPCLEEWVKQTWYDNKDRTPLMEIEERRRIEEPIKITIEEIKSEDNL